MVPAHQCLVAQYLVGIKADLRLVVQYELTLCQGCAEGLFEGEGVDVGEVQRGVEEAVLGASRLLGRIHRGIGAADQAVDLLAIAWANADTDTGAGVDLLAIQGIGGRELVHQFTYPGVDLLFSALAGQQDHELVTAKARRFVAWLQQALDTPGHGLQQQVANLVPERIVDRLEAVHVDEQDRHQSALAPLSGERKPCDFDELAAVVQAAEVIGGRGMAAASVFVFKPPDQLLVDLLRLYQGTERLLALAQQAQGPEQAGENHQSHAQV
ncbi:hypothetical protein D3C81_1376020 [compost metagenome]